MVFLVDTLNFRVANYDLKFLLKFLGLSELKILWECKRGRYNYSSAIYYGGIEIMYGGTKGFECYVSMSGKGCRTYEDLRKDTENLWTSLFTDIRDEPENFHIARIDIACDDYTEALEIENLVKYYRKCKFSSRCNNVRYLLGSEECFYVGSPQSEILLRIYNKKLERGYTEPEDLNGKPWYRAELQLRDKKATSAIDVILKLGIGSAFQGILTNHCRFLAKVNDGENAQRINNAGFWDYITNSSAKIRLITEPGSEYNKAKLDRYEKQFRSSVKTLIYSEGLTADELYSRFCDCKIELNTDQETYIDRCRDERERAIGTYQALHIL